MKNKSEEITQANPAFQVPCSSCQQPMKAVRKSILHQSRLFVCVCGHQEWISEQQFEVITGQCFICGKGNCCARNHRFNGIIPAGMGL